MRGAGPRHRRARCRGAPCFPLLARSFRRRLRGERVDETVGRARTTATELRRSTISIACRQQEDQRCPETASADRPLLQGHAHAAPGRQAEREGQDRSECDNDESAVHRTSFSRPMSGSAFAGSRRLQRGSRRRRSPSRPARPERRGRPNASRAPAWGWRLSGWSSAFV
jgi:hypothetical protein